MKFQIDKAKAVTGLAASALLLTAPLATAFAKPIPDRSRFCVPHGSGWVLQSYAPLVDAKNGTSVVQAIYTQKWLSRVVVKSYNERHELLFVYKFTEDGKLIALHAYLQRWGQWLAEADLYPDADGLIPRPDVHYRLRQDGGIISDPEGGAQETRVFMTAPVYRTTAEIPCAVLFREAEKMNATQE